MDTIELMEMKVDLQNLETTLAVNHRLNVDDWGKAFKLFCLIRNCREIVENSLIHGH